MLKKLLNYVLALSICAGSMTAINDVNVQAAMTEGRVYEQLDRGLVAMKTNEGIYLSWRYFEADAGSSFYVYRDGEKIGEVTKSTDYIDANGKTSSKYSVSSVKEGVEGEKSEEVTAFSSGSNYFDIPLDIPADTTLSDGETYSYSAGDASCGDLDGDGEYEIVLKWEANAKDNSQSGYTGNVFIDAYELSGEKLWRIDLGKNIRAGAHYTQFMVYDLDGDGKAEVGMKTAPGSLDGKGNYVNTKSSDSTVKSGDNSANYVNTGGYILSGPEYYTVFSGETGEAIDTINYPTPRGIDANNTMDIVWGDGYGNRGDRFLSAVAHLDGKTPSIIVWRGYYFGKEGPGRTGIASINFDGKKLTVGNYFDTYSKAANGYTTGNEQYIGQGNHSMAVGDIDGDGCDEFMSGALCLDNDFSVKWCTGLGHGDAHHLAEYDPTNESPEYFVVHESGNFGMSVIDTITGEVVFHEDGSSDTGRGIMANVGAGGYYQIYSARNGVQNAVGNNQFETSGMSKGSMNFRIFWDGDLYDELLDGTTITSYSNNRMETIFTADGCISVNGTKSNPALSADLFGDWREEVVYPLSNNSALRVYATNIKTQYRIPTLMHDDLYRAAVAAENVAYNQPPHIGFVLSEDDFKAKVTNLKIETMPSKTEYKVGEDLNISDMVLKAELDDGTVELVQNYTVSGYDKYNVGTQTLNVNYRGFDISVDITVSADMTIENGEIKKYTGSDESVIIPRTIDGEKISVIAKDAFMGTTVKELNILSNITEVENGAISSDIKLICQKGTAAYIYAIINGLETEVTEFNMLDSYVDTDFSEAQYSAYKNNIIMTQTNAMQEKTIDGFLYHVGGRNKGGDGTTGYSVMSDSEGEYLKATAGRFSSAGRNAFLTFNNAPTFESGLDYVFSTDIYFPEDLYDEENKKYKATIKVKISDGATAITEFSKDSLGIEYDTWYKYMLIYHDGKYIQVLTDTDGSIISTEEIISNVMSVAKLEFNFDGGLGNGESTSVYLDNMKIYSSEAAMGDARFKVLGEYSGAIRNATIKIANNVLTTDRNGIAEISLPSDVYMITVTAENCEEYTSAVVVGGSSYEEIILEEPYIDVESISGIDANIELVKGSYKTLTPVVMPENASEKTLIYSSSDEAVAVVSEDGTICAVSAGEAVITIKAKSNEKISTVCNVKVTEPTDDKKAVAVKISGGNDVIFEGTSAEFKATAYNSYGDVTESEIVWSVDNDKVTVENGVVTIPENLGAESITIKASLKDDEAVYAVKTISVKTVAMENTASIDFESEEYNDLSIIVQGDEASSVKTVLNTTFGAGVRTGGNDSTTGISVITEGDNHYLRGFAGRFSNSGRNGYMIIDDAVNFAGSDTYILTMDVKFENETAQLKISDGTNALNTLPLSVTVDEIEAGKQYTLKIVYSNGTITQTFIDEEGNIVSNKSYTSAITSFKRFDFLTSDTAVSSGICVDNISVNKASEFMGMAEILVLSENDEPIENAEVVVNNQTIKTDSDGYARIEAEMGVYKAQIKADGYGKRELSVAVSSESPIYKVKLGLIKAEIANSSDDVTVLNVNNTSGTEINCNIITAAYKNGILVDTDIRNEVLTSGDSNIILNTELYSEYDDVKIFIWSADTKLEPVSAAVKK